MNIDETCYKKIHVVINPTSGSPRPVLRTINDVFHPLNIDWSVSITKNPGDAHLFAEKALETDIDCLAVCGGDGTISEAATSLIGSDIPLAILPGGTANIMSVELGIPNDLSRACKLILNKRQYIKKIDVGQVGDKHFILRVSAGFEAEVVRITGKKLKSNVGLLAYALSGFGALLKTKSTHYNITIDGKKIECYGLSYVIANSGNLGIPGVTLSPKINLCDGLLDLIIIRAGDLKTLFYLGSHPHPGDIIAEFFQHWQAKDIQIEAQPAHHVQKDGEMWGKRTVSAKVIPQALSIITPPKKSR
ncbi:MAG: diacylglycerol kinase family lipid kinase [Candidatus Omnitrophica bacterium]|nr:diacylglycerol kinase family lipid kinase [Candidatus Omnitrophota bacterium]